MPRAAQADSSERVGRSVARVVMPAASGSTMTSTSWVSSALGLIVAVAPRAARIGPAATTVTSVDPISSAAVSAVPSPAMPAIATEATSAGATPMTRDPSRSGPGSVSCLAAQANAGSVTEVTRRTTVSRPAVVRACRTCPRVIETPMLATRTARATGLPSAPARPAWGRKGNSDRRDTHD